MRRWVAIVATILFVASGVVAAVGVEPAGATFAGKNGRITFDRFLPNKDGPDVGGLEIFSTRPDGTERRLTFSKNGRSSFLSDWSPDGSQIAFSSDRIDRAGREDVVQVYVMSRRGENSGLRQLTVGPGFHADPAWSPTGAEIAIESDWGNYPAAQGIWIIPASDSNGVTRREARRVTRLPQGLDFDAEPQYSPDGRWIAFARFKDCEESCLSAIFRVHPGGGGLARLTPWRLEASAPDWSPDGTKIAFDSCDSGRIGCAGNIYLMNADGTGRKRITNNPVVTASRFQFANNPVWAPDGTRLVYTQWVDGGFPLRIVTASPDGSNKRVVVGGDFFQNKADWGARPVR